VVIPSPQDDSDTDSSETSDYEPVLPKSAPKTRPIITPDGRRRWEINSSMNF